MRIYVTSVVLKAHQEPDGSWNWVADRFYTGSYMGNYEVFPVCTADSKEGLLGLDNDEGSESAGGSE
jgi:hypothetical protein